MTSPMDAAKVIKAESSISESPGRLKSRSEPQKLSSGTQSCRGIPSHLTDQRMAGGEEQSRNSGGICQVQTSDLLTMTPHTVTHSPKIRSIPIDEVAPVGVTWDVMTAAEHGGQHGVLELPQRGQASGEVRTPDVQRDDLREL